MTVRIAADDEGWYDLPPGDAARLQAEAAELREAQLRVDGLPLPIHTGCVLGNARA